MDVVSGIGLTGGAPTRRGHGFTPGYVSNVMHDTHMSKLTLSVDAGVVRRAKRHAAARGISVSALVERYLAVLAGAGPAIDAPPVLRLLRGAARGVDPANRRRHLLRKYR